MQLHFTMSDLTGKLQVATYVTAEGIKRELTPQGMIQAGEVSKETAKDNEPDFWEWLEHRDKLLSMDGGAFCSWKAGAGRTINGFQMPENIVDGKPFVVPLEIGYAIVTPVMVEDKGKKGGCYCISETAKE